MGEEGKGGGGGGVSSFKETTMQCKLGNQAYDDVYLELKTP